MYSMVMSPVASVMIFRCVSLDGDADRVVYHYWRGEGGMYEELMNLACLKSIYGCYCLS